MVLFFTLTSCFNNDLYTKATSRLSDLDYTVSISPGTITGTAIDLPPARYDTEAYAYTLTIRNPNSEGFTVEHIYFADGGGVFGIEDDVDGIFLEGKSDLTVNILFGPRSTGKISETLVIDTNWSPQRRYTVTGRGVEPGLYVTTDGSDTEGDGSPTRPFYSLNRAMDMVDNGMTVHVARGTYTYDEIQSITGQNVRIYGSYSDDGLWTRDEDSHSSVIHSTVDDDTGATIEFTGYDLSTETEFSGFTVYGTSKDVTSWAVIRISDGSPAVYNNSIHGSSTATRSVGVNISGGSNAVVLINDINATPVDETVSESYAVLVDQYSGFPLIILNTIFGGNASTESAGISLLLGEMAGADIYGNSV
ncbi:MAG: DUF1565 domain-containing protein, partial [Spirochaetota bacterium]